MRMIDLDVPLDIAQYAEGQRIMGYFVLNTVPETIDGQQKEEPQYLVLLNEPKDGLAWDYNQVRVFTRNRNKHRYETAYRERNMEGYFPVTTGHAVFDKEGDLPTFTIRKMNDNGQIERSHLQDERPHRAPRAHSGRTRGPESQTRCRCSRPPTGRRQARQQQAQVEDQEEDQVTQAALDGGGAAFLATANPAPFCLLKSAATSAAKFDSAQVSGQKETQCYLCQSMKSRRPTPSATWVAALGFDRGLGCGQSSRAVAACGCSGREGHGR